MENQVLSVSEFVALVNQTLEYAYPLVQVKGEVTGLAIKEWYANFSIKDEESIIRCYNSGKLSAAIEDGMEVLITGTPKVHNKYGLSLNVTDIKPFGQGALQREYELLKSKLEREGLFADERKRQIPRYPKSIGLVTSLQADAYSDFLRIVGERWGGLHIRVCPVQVQGEAAPAQIINAIKYLNELKSPLDAIAIVRGGGSLEDLHAFNTESVAREISLSRTPTIVGVGHEADITLADLVSDKRASTPSNAAELLVPDKISEIRNLDNITSHLNGLILHSVQSNKLRVEHASTRIGRFLRIPIEHTVDLQHRLIRGSERVIQGIVHSLVNLERVLKNVDPQKVLNRGYAIARKGSTVIKAKGQVKPGDELMLQLAKGQVKSEVTDA